MSSVRSTANATAAWQSARPSSHRADSRSATRYNDWLSRPRPHRLSEGCDLDSTECTSNGFGGRRVAGDLRQRVAPFVVRTKVI
jgi:hypothetical protein